MMKASGIRKDRLSGHQGARTTDTSRRRGAVSATTTDASMRDSWAPRQR